MFLLLCAGGVINLPELDVVVAAAVELVKRMQHHVSDWYAKCSDPASLHPWHDRQVENGPISSLSGTVVGKTVLTDPRLHDCAPNFLWIYQWFVLKTANEAVVEGMCSVIAKHARPERGLAFERYAKEAMLVWNMPDAAESHDFLSDALNYHFRGSRYNDWHFWSHDERERSLVPIVSKVIDRLRKGRSKFHYMK